MPQPKLVEVKSSDPEYLNSMTRKVMRLLKDNLVPKVCVMGRGKEMLRCAERVVLGLGQWAKIEKVDTTSKRNIKSMTVTVVRAPGFADAYIRSKRRAEEIIELRE